MLHGRSVILSFDFRSNAVKAYLGRMIVSECFIICRMLSHHLGSKNEDGGGEGGDQKRVQERGLCTCHRLPRGVGPRADNGDFDKLVFQRPCIPPHVGHYFPAKSPVLWGRQAPNKTKPKRVETASTQLKSQCPTDERNNFNKI